MAIAPLAERLRPEHLDQYIGQEHLVGKGKVLRVMAEQHRIVSMILWGPPGVGKTTLANILGKAAGLPFVAISAVASGIKEIKEVIQLGEKSGRIVLFIDEIHRFNKAQQDALLGAVEKGTVTLVGATTENPSFEVISALLSRCQVYVLEPLSKSELIHMAEQAIAADKELQAHQVQLKEHRALLQFSGGDGRKLLNLLALLMEV
ncbi:MAG TPA: AAA family ATPase, partial [Bacteroidetes bacterium]|nr:AAA family ATPase [Bacteroidota bacterium]